VVAIIGILAAIAIPNFMKFQARARQAEPKAMLKGIFVAQKTYMIATGKYSDSFDAIGFAPESGNRYSYGLVPGCAVAEPTDARGSSCIGQDAAKYPNAPAPHDPVAEVGVIGCPSYEFVATAQGQLDGDAQPDTWVITSSTSLTLQNTGCNEVTIPTPGDPTNVYNDVGCP